jgi:hypothetical protein
MKTRNLVATAFIVAQYAGAGLIAVWILTLILCNPVGPPPFPDAASRARAALVGAAVLAVPAIPMYWANRQALARSGMDPRRAWRVVVPCYLMVLLAVLSQINRL